MAAGSTADEQIFVIYVITIEDSQISHAYIQKLEWGYVKPLHWVYAVCTITQEHHEYHAFRGMFHTVQTIAEGVGVKGNIDTVRKSTTVVQSRSRRMRKCVQLSFSQYMEYQY